MNRDVESDGVGRGRFTWWLAGLMLAGVILFGVKSISTSPDVAESGKVESLALKETRKRPVEQGASELGATRASIPLSALFHGFQGDAVLPDTRIEDEVYCAINPVYGFRGLKVTVPAEDIENPLSAFKGGRGELTFAFSNGKPITSKSVGELFVKDGTLVYAKRLSLSYRRGSRMFFLIRQLEENGIQEFGIGFDRRLALDDEKCRVLLVMEDQHFTGLEFDSLGLAEGEYLTLNVTGKPLPIDTDSTIAMWFRFDEDGRLSRVP